MIGHQFGLIPESVSQIIGKISEKDVKEIIDMSLSGKYIFHGIKFHSRMQSVEYEGIKPLTSEGGNASFWSSGHCLFGVVQDGRLETRDSPFFDYSSSRQNELGMIHMNLALASYPYLEENGIKSKRGYEENSYVTLQSIVKPHLMELISIDIECDDIGHAFRDHAQKAEQILFQEIYDSLSLGNVNGKRVKKNFHI